MKVINMNMNRDQGAGARYAGSSWVGKVGRGKVVLGSVMGRGEEGVGVVDTDGRGWEVLNLEGEEGSE